jgi:hypothetical protein
VKRVLSLTRGRTEFTYYPGMVRVPQGSAPDFKNKSYRITADVEIPDDGAEGVFADAGWAIQWPWAIPCFRVNLSSTTTSWYYNLVGVDRTSVSSYDKLPAANTASCSPLSMTAAVSAKAA